MAGSYHRVFAGVAAWRERRADSISIALWVDTACRGCDAKAQHSQEDASDGLEPSQANRIGSAPRRELYTSIKMRWH